MTSTTKKPEGTWRHEQHVRVAGLACELPESEVRIIGGKPYILIPLFTPEPEVAE